MEQALADPPIKMTLADPFERWEGRTVWVGESGETYHGNTLKGLIKRGLLQYILPLSDTPHFVQKTKEHEDEDLKEYYEKMNKKFID